MSEIETKLASLGLILPPPVRFPADVVLPFAFVLVRGNRAIIRRPLSRGSFGEPPLVLISILADRFAAESCERSQRVRAAACPARFVVSRYYGLTLIRRMLGQDVEAVGAYSATS